MTATRDELLALYDASLSLVYGYLLPRCGSAPLARDLTAATFLAAVDEARADDPPRVGVPWIIGVARHTLLDHWRSEYRAQRRLGALADDAPPLDDSWDMQLDVVRARETLKQLGPQHRAALTLHYLDDLPLPRVAALLERPVHATETLLLGARSAFRRAYDDREVAATMSDRPGSDPFEALLSPVVPADPDPAFAADLRTRISGAFGVPRRATASEVTQTGSAPDSVAPHHGDIGYVSLWVPDVERAGVFFSAVLGWRYTTGSGPQGRQVEGVVPRHGLWGRQDRSTLFLCFIVDDVDEALERVRDAGGQAGEPQGAPGKRVADCVDDQGMPFALVATVGPERPSPRGPANGTHHGDLAYITVEVVDSVRARAFYGSVLDWRFGPGSVTDGWGVDDVVPMVGLVGQQPSTTVVPMYRVDDIDAAVDRVRTAGGTADDPAPQPYGMAAACVDDQDTRFWLAQLQAITET